MYNKDFNFIEYAESLEKLLDGWYHHSKTGPKHPGNLGSAREYFIKNILKKILPSSLEIGKGEITDGYKRSREQDIVIYRGDFPVLRFGDTNLYFIEGVIATIEVKSDLSTGSPTNLEQSFRNVASLAQLKCQGVPINGKPEELHKLQAIHSPKAFVFGYRGWKEDQAFLNNLVKAGNSVDWVIPDFIYQPGMLLLKNSLFAPFQTNPSTTISSKDIQIALTSEHPFALFFQFLLRSIMSRVHLFGISPGIDATLYFGLNNYFDMPNIPLNPLKIVPDIKPS